MHVLMSCVKDEGPFVLEFVAHHLVLGFDRIMMASNDCTDGTDNLLAALHQAGYVQHLDHKVPAGQVPQHVGYAKLRAQFGLDDVEWLAVLDVDEFLHVTVGDGSVQALTAVAPSHTDVIALFAKTFGTELWGTWHPGRVCQRFTYRLATRSGPSNEIKSITRKPMRFRKLYEHMPNGFQEKRSLRVLRGDGTEWDITPEAQKVIQIRRLIANSPMYQLAHFNHYAVKTVDSFALRRLRGRGAVPMGGKASLRHTEKYFISRVWKARVFDDSIAVYGPAVEEKMAQMLVHPAIAAAQADCEARYAAMLAEMNERLDFT